MPWCWVCVTCDMLPWYHLSKCDCVCIGLPGENGLPWKPSPLPHQETELLLHPLWIFHLECIFIFVA